MAALACWALQASLAQRVQAQVLAWGPGQASVLEPEPASASQEAAQALACSALLEGSLVPWAWWAGRLPRVQAS